MHRIDAARTGRLFAPTVSHDDALVSRVLAEARADVQAELERVFARRRRTGYGPLYDLLADYPFREGKGLRPATCFAACRAVGGRTEQALLSATALENRACRRRAGGLDHCAFFQADVTDLPRRSRAPSTWSTTRLPIITTRTHPRPRRRWYDTGTSMMRMRASGRGKGRVMRAAASAASGSRSSGTPKIASSASTGSITSAIPAPRDHQAAERDLVPAQREDAADHRARRAA